MDQGRFDHMEDLVYPPALANQNQNAFLSQNAYQYPPPPAFFDEIPVDPALLAEDQANPRPPLAQPLPRRQPRPRRHHQYLRADGTMDAETHEELKEVVEALRQDTANAEVEIENLQDENAELKQRLARVEALLADRARDPVDDADDDDREEEREVEDDGEEDDGHFPFACPFQGCNLIFKKHSSLTNHLASTHNSDPATRKAFVCPLCSASFDTDQLMRGHRTRHAAAIRRRHMRIPVPGGCRCPNPECAHECVTRENRMNHMSRSDACKAWRLANPQWNNRQ